MIKRSSTSGTAAVLIAAMLAACQSGQTVPPTVATLSPSTTAVAPSATLAPTTPPSPSPSGAVNCPSTLPTTVFLEELADAACYGTAELTIEGWLADSSFDVSTGERSPDWTNAFSGLSTRSPSGRDFVLDFLMYGAEPRLWTVALPGSGIDLSDLGRWVRVRGHFNDPVAMTCSVKPDPDFPAESPDPLGCDQLFVVSAVEDAVGREPSCTTETPMSMNTFLDVDAACFRGRTFQIEGWEDPGEGFGGMAPIFPISTGSLELGESQLVSDRWEVGTDRLLIFPWTVKGSGISFDHSDRHVIVSAVLGGSAAATCAPAYDAWTWAPPASWAQHRCEHLLVITGVRDR